MIPKTKFWRLLDFHLIKRLDKEEMNHLMSIIIMKNFEKGVQIELKSNTTSNVFFLKKGSVKVVNFNPDGKEIIKDVIPEGDIFGVLGLIYDKDDGDYAITLEDSHFCVIDALVLKEIMNNNVNINNYVLMLAGLRIKKLENRIESLSYKDAELRIKDFIIEFLTDFGEEKEDFIIAKNLFSNNEIGKLTATSRQTVSKTLNDLKRNNIIDFDKNMIRISKNNLFIS